MSTTLTRVIGSGSVERVHIVSDFDEPTNSTFVHVVIEGQMQGPEERAIDCAEHPVLAAIWDNESDAVYDHV